MQPKAIALLILFALVVIVLLQNTQVIVLRLFFWKISMSQIVLLFLVLLLGFITGLITAKLTGGKKAAAHLNP
jgi:uncharacterized integral membrane protein